MVLLGKGQDVPEGTEHARDPNNKEVERREEEEEEDLPQGHWDFEGEARVSRQSGC